MNRVGYAFVVGVLLALTVSGCASVQTRCERRVTCCFKQQAPPEPQDTEKTSEHAVLREIFFPSDEVRAARLRFAAAVIVVAAEIGFEVYKAQR